MYDKDARLIAELAGLITPLAAQLDPVTYAKAAEAIADAGDRLEALSGAHQTTLDFLLESEGGSAALVQAIIEDSPGAEDPPKPELSDDGTGSELPEGYVRCGCGAIVEAGKKHYPIGTDGGSLHEPYGPEA